MGTYALLGMVEHVISGMLHEQTVVIFSNENKMNCLGMYLISIYVVGSATKQAAPKLRRQPKAKTKLLFVFCFFVFIKKGGEQLELFVHKIKKEICYCCNNVKIYTCSLPT